MSLTYLHLNLCSTLFAYIQFRLSLNLINLYANTSNIENLHILFYDIRERQGRPISRFYSTEIVQKMTKIKFVFHLALNIFFLEAYNLLDIKSTIFCREIKQTNNGLEMYVYDICQLVHEIRESNWTCNNMQAGFISSLLEVNICTFQI